MKIAICEDEHYWIDALKKSLLKWAASRRIECTYSSFTSSQALINYFKDNPNVDVLFLDILLGEQVIDGMGLAKRIRKMGNTVPIIFVTSDSLRASDGYLVEAVGYLHKPIDENRLTLFLDRIVKRQKRQKVIKIINEGRVTHIAQKDIIYAEVRDHTIIYHTINNSISHRGTLNEILEVLEKDDFVQIHRSFVVALDKIDNIKTTYPYAVEMVKNEKTVTLAVSRKYIKNLLDRYSDNLLEKMI